MVMHARAPLVSASAPARQGETLIVWAYGLGALDHPLPPACCQSPDQIPLALQPFSVNLSYLDAAGLPFKRLANLIPTYAGSSGTGVYQLHFVVPAVPSGIASCRDGLGNVTVQISGPNSSDTAQICLQP